MALMQKNKKIGQVNALKKERQSKFQPFQNTKNEGKKGIGLTVFAPLEI